MAKKKSHALWCFKSQHTGACLCSHSGGHVRGHCSALI